MLFISFSHLSNASKLYERTERERENGNITEIVKRTDAEDQRKSTVLGEDDRDLKLENKPCIRLPLLLLSDTRRVRALLSYRKNWYFLSIKLYPNFCV